MWNKTITASTCYKACAQRQTHESHKPIDKGHPPTHANCVEQPPSTRIKTNETANINQAPHQAKQPDQMSTFGQEGSTVQGKPLPSSWQERSLTFCRRKPTFWHTLKKGARRPTSATNIQDIHSALSAHEANQTRSAGKTASTHCAAFPRRPPAKIVGAVPMTPPRRNRRAGQRSLGAAGRPPADDCPTSPLALGGGVTRRCQG